MSSQPQVSSARRRIRADLAFVAGLCVALSIAAAVQNGMSGGGSLARVTAMVGLAVCFAVTAGFLHLRRDRSVRPGPFVG